MSKDIDNLLAELDEIERAQTLNEPSTDDLLDQLLNDIDSFVMEDDKLPTRVDRLISDLEALEPAINFPNPVEDSRKQLAVDKGARERLDAAFDFLEKNSSPNFKTIKELLSSGKNVIYSQRKLLGLIESLTNNMPEKEKKEIQTQIVEARQDIDKLSSKMRDAILTSSRRMVSEIEDVSKKGDKRPEMVSGIRQRSGTKREEPSANPVKDRSPRRGTKR